jgi:hypothetical protein
MIAQADGCAIRWSRPETGSLVRDVLARLAPSRGRLPTHTARSVLIDRKLGGILRCSRIPPPRDDDPWIRTTAEDLPAVTITRSGSRAEAWKRSRPASWAQTRRASAGPAVHRLGGAVVGGLKPDSARWRAGRRGERQNPIDLIGVVAEPSA